MDLRQRVLDLCNPSDHVVLEWINKQLDDFPIVSSRSSSSSSFSFSFLSLSRAELTPLLLSQEPDQTPEDYITLRAKSINISVDDIPSASESGPSQSPASTHHQPGSFPIHPPFFLSLPPLQPFLSKQRDKSTQRRLEVTLFVFKLYQTQKPSPNETLLEKPKSPKRSATERIHSG